LTWYRQRGASSTNTGGFADFDAVPAAAAVSSFNFDQDPFVSLLPGSSSGSSEKYQC
jgi:hypothetical protein